MDDSLNPNDRARRPAGFKIASYLNRSCHYNSIAWQTAQRLFNRLAATGVEKERLRIASPVFKLLLCRCDEASDASRLGNNEIKPPKQISLNSVTKNRTLICLGQANLIKQRTAADAGMVHGFIWNKEEQGADADVQPGLLTPQKKTAPCLTFKLDSNQPPRCR